MSEVVHKEIGADFVVEYSEGKLTVTENKIDGEEEVFDFPLIERELEKQAGRLLIEITAQCKEVTEALVEEAIKQTALKCKSIGQRIIKNSDDWRLFADAVEKEFNIKIEDILK